MLKIKRTTWLILAVLVTLLILTACFIPGRSVPEVRIPFMDKWVHMAVFGALAFCWSAYFSRSHLAAKLILLLACVAFGLAIEMVQGAGWVSNRSFEWYDVLADGAGALAGLALYSLLRRRYFRMAKPTD